MTPPELIGILRRELARLKAAYPAMTYQLHVTGAINTDGDHARLRAKAIIRLDGAEAALFVPDGMLGRAGDEVQGNLRELLGRALADLREFNQEGP